MNIQAELLQLVPVVVVLGNPELLWAPDHNSVPDNNALHYYLSQAGTEVVAEAQIEADKHYIP